MLKDKFSKFFKPNNKENDSFKLNIMDGFVDIKAYKVNKDGSKKIVYHDCGDNVVTDWMRHAIMMLLTGVSFSKDGSSIHFDDAATSRKSTDSITFMKMENHADGKNYDGYLLNRKNYLWDGNKNKIYKYSKTTMSDNHIYSMFPTKVLFGTGKEYGNWQEFEDENMTSNPAWYQEIANLYGSSDPSVKFNKYIGEDEEIKCNSYSGTIAKNIYSGSGRIRRARTVNVTSSLPDSNDKPSSMNKNYGVVGAIKTPYFDKADSDMLSIEEGNKGVLLKAEYRGIGRPCFIYFSANSNNSSEVNEEWDSPTSDVYLSKNDDSKYLNKITFKINMPSQTSSTDSNKYYPYNGYTLRQIGLFNDAILTCKTDGSGDSDAKNNMPCGMMLAVKNIASLEKIADLEVAMTWTLTI